MMMILTNALACLLIVRAALCDTDSDASIAWNKGKPEIVILKEVIDILQKELKDERTTRKQLDQDLKDLTEKHRQLTKECDDIKADNVHLTDQYNNVSVLTSDLKNEIKQQQVEIGAIRQEFDNELNKKFAELSTLLSQMSIEKDELKSENVRLSDSLKNTSIYITNLCEELKPLKNKMGTIKQDIQTESTARIESDRQITGVTTRLKNEIGILKQQVQNENTARIHFGRNITEITRKLNQLTKADDEIKADHMQLTESYRNYTDDKYTVLLAEIKSIIPLQKGL